MTAVPCTCAACRHLGARIWRELEAARAERELDAAELTARWHAYAPHLQALTEELPHRTAHRCFMGVSDTPALRALLEWERERLESERSIAVLAGPHGTGKTLAAVYVALFRMAADEPIFVTAHQLARDLREKETRGETLRRCLDASVLIVDDLGKEAPSASFARDVDEIVDTVYQGYADLVITTNLKPSAFRARYGEGVADRMRERGQWIACGGKSLRVKPRSEAP